MIVSINQPAYLPWLGYFDRIAKSDLHIVLDNVQIERNTSTSFTNRNRIKTSEGSRWLTIPLRKSSSEEQSLINASIVDGVHWAGKHFKTIEQYYNRSKCYSDYREWFRSFYNEPDCSLVSLLQESTEFFLDALNIRTEMVYASELRVAGRKSDLILRLCKAVGATEYLSGPFGRQYLDCDSFLKEGVLVRFHDYNHPVYPQLYGDFIPYMSAVDLLANCGGASAEILRSEGAAS